MSARSLPECCARYGARTVLGVVIDVGIIKGARRSEVCLINCPSTNAAKHCPSTHHEIKYSHFIFTTISIRQPSTSMKKIPGFR